MEVELKYVIEDDSIVSDILEDHLLTSLECEGTRKTKAMRAIYYDTEAGEIREKMSAFRVRLEGDEFVATIKIGGKSSEGLHQRYEVNKVLTDEDFINDPKLSVFRDDERVAEVLGEYLNKPLVEVMEMNYVRELVTVKYEDSILEVAIDQGDIWTEDDEAPICELEIEIIEGNVEDLKSFGEMIRNAYNLKPEDTSKFARGVALLD